MTRNPYPGTPDPDTQAIARRLDKARAELAAATEWARADARRLRAQGVPLRTIAAWLGVTRPTITDWIKP